MPNRDYVSVIFSQPLALQPGSKKIEALQGLYRYLAQNGIAAGDGEAGITEIARELFQEKLDMTGHFQSGILSFALDEAEQADVRELGFVVSNDNKKALAL